MFKYLSMNFIDFERALGRGSCENSKDIEMCAQEWCWRRRIQDPLQPLLRHYNVLLQPNASSHHDNEHLHFSCHPKKCHKQRNKFETKQSHCGDPKSFDLTWTSMWLHRAQAPAGGPPPHSQRCHGCHAAWSQEVDITANKNINMHDYQVSGIL